MLAFSLWFFRFMGGADAKLLIAYSLILPYQGFANAYAVSMIFIIIWAILYLLYSIIYRINKGKSITKEDNRVQVAR
jgi:Flp pilus assembly protein protease CpaA